MTDPAPDTNGIVRYVRRKFGDTLAQQCESDGFFLGWSRDENDRGIAAPNKWDIVAACPECNRMCICTLGLDQFTEEKTRRRSQIRALLGLSHQCPHVRWWGWRVDPYVPASDVQLALLWREIGIGRYDGWAFRTAHQLVEQLAEEGLCETLSVHVEVEDVVYNFHFEICRHNLG